MRAGHQSYNITIQQFLWLFGFLFSEECRQLEFNSEHTFDGQRLKGHVIRTDNVTDNGTCEIACFMEPNCVSYNFKNTPIENGKYNCELNNSTLNGQRDKLETNSDYVYCEAEVRQDYELSFKLAYSLIKKT